MRLLLLPLLLLWTALLPALSDPVPTPSSALTVPDLLPLKKALAPLEGYGTLNSLTTIRMTGTRQGLSVTLREKLRIISRRPGRFRAELTQFDASNKPHKKLLIISNALQVWTYRPIGRQYSVESYAAFQAADNDVPTLGLIVGGFFLGDGYPLIQGFRNITPSNSADVAAALTGMDVALSRHAESAAGKDDYVYRLVLAKQNLAYQFFVDSETNRLTRVELRGVQDGTQITYREDITQIGSQTNAPQSTFAFVPPIGAFKTMQVAVDPF